MHPFHGNKPVIRIPVVAEQHHVSIGGIYQWKGLGPGFIERQQKTRIVLCLRSHFVGRDIGRFLFCLKDANRHSVNEKKIVGLLSTLEYTFFDGSCGNVGGVFLSRDNLPASIGKQLVYEYTRFFLWRHGSHKHVLSESMKHKFTKKYAMRKLPCCFSVTIQIKRVVTKCLWFSELLKILVRFLNEDYIVTN